MSDTAVSAGAVPTPETAEFWLGCRQGKLRMQFCKPCDAFYFYPRPFCPGMAAPSGEYHQRYLEKHGRASCAVTIR